MIAPPKSRTELFQGTGKALIIGKAGRSAIGTLVERSSRYVVLLHLPHGRTAEAVRAFIAEHKIRHVVLDWNDPVAGNDRMRLVKAYVKACLKLELESRDPTGMVWRVSGMRDAREP
jgi:hypothetical protein